MKLKKCMKRISAIFLAATMVVVALPNQPIVKADDTDVPDEILFPINILDFPADNLFFEDAESWMGGYEAKLNLTAENIPGVNVGGEKGKKLVADKLETDKTSIYYGLPVYREATVDYIAKRVLATLNETDNTDYAFNKPYVDGKINPISMKNYIRKQDWKVINAEDGEVSNGATVRSSDYCLKTKYVGDIGGPSNGSITLTYKSTFAGNHDVRFFQMAAEARDLYISVNNGAPQKVSCGRTSTTWDNIPSQTPVVKSISGFIVGTNTIVISGDGAGGWAPDLDRIEIQNLTGAEPEPVDPNELSKVEAEINGSNVYPGGGNDMRIERYVNATLGYSNNGYARIGNWWWDTTYSYKSGNFSLPAGYNAGKYDIKVYGVRNADNYAGFIVNSNAEQGKDGLGRSNNLKKPFFIISNVDLEKNNNTIAFRGNNTNIDKFVICKAGTATTTVSSPDDYPLGTYAASKAKYNIDEDGDKISDYGWYDIETCYDYAYFITANLFKHHPSLNTVYSKYTNLVFHKVNQDGKNYYEFMGDQIHNENISQADYNNKINSVYNKIGAAADDPEIAADLAKYNAVKKGIGRLVYNPDTKMIRNACDADGNYVGPKAGTNEYVTNSGYMFVCDGDDYNKDPVNHYAGEGIKKYPELDPPKNASDGDKKDHNYNYTIRTHSRFVYKEGTDQKFFFSGDDDVYVFVNGNLIVDLGGQHQQEDGSINLDSLAEIEGNPYGLVDKKAVDFDFFYIERHSTSSNFWGKMSFQLRTDEVELLWPSEPDDIAGMTDTKIPYGFTIDLNYQFSSLRDLSTSTSLVFRDDIGNYIGHDKFELSDQVKIGNKYKVKETVDGVEKIVTKEDPTKYHMTAIVHRVQPDETYVDEIYDFQFADPVTATDDEKKAVMDFFKALTLEQGDKFEISGIMYDTSKKKFAEFEPTSESNVRQLHYQVHVDYMTYMTMGGTNSIEDTEGFKQTIHGDVDAKVVIGGLKISCSIEGLDENYEVKDDLSAFGEFKLKRLENEDDLSTPDVDERYLYTNRFDLKNSGTTIIFDAAEHPELPAETTIKQDPIPKGTYDLEMDIQKLTGYDLFAEIWVDGELKVVVSRTTDKVYDDCDVVVQDPDYLSEDLGEGETLETVLSMKKIRIKIDPKLNGEEWNYPEVEYKLKAYRSVNPLKDLT